MGIRQELKGAEELSHCTQFFGSLFLMKERINIMNTKEQMVVGA